MKLWMKSLACVVLTVCAGAVVTGGLVIGACADNNKVSILCPLPPGVAVCALPAGVIANSTSCNGPFWAPRTGAVATSTNDFGCSASGTTPGNHCSSYTVGGVLAQAECHKQFQCWIKVYTVKATGFMFSVCEPDPTRPVGPPAFADLKATFTCDGS